MIQAVMVISTQAKPRLLKFYNFQPPEKHQDLVRSVFQLLSARPDSVSNFVEVDSIFGPGTKMVYKHLATLYFVFVFDSSENELAMLDLVQVFVETLDRCFKNVCELDIVFNFNKSHAMRLDDNSLEGEGPRTLVNHIKQDCRSSSRVTWSPTFRSCVSSCYDDSDVLLTSHSCLAPINLMQMHTILDEMILGGQVIETSSEEIMKSVEEIARLEKQSSTTSLIPKSISERFSR
ncbi:hypothetical protein U9M48_006693 [Paspalum notatum var. saurae]|uniref:AP complex mu/sigma subunit domain-containing protein n=1 Tax=Paspalum notatum var. saurae TaxID=547442 RepID=A0AAQ3PPM3_PASNO